MAHVKTFGSSESVEQNVRTDLAADGFLRPPATGRCEGSCAGGGADRCRFRLPLMDTNIIPSPAELQGCGIQERDGREWRGGGVDGT